MMACNQMLDAFWMDEDAEYAKKSRNCAVRKEMNAAMRYWTINIKKRKRMNNFKKKEKNR